jgi:TPP-dependent pyruvate/acetoin dehydrogenase alpha subunit
MHAIFERVERIRIRNRARTIQDQARVYQQKPEKDKAMASNPTQELSEEFLSTLRKSQDTVLDAIKTWADAVQSVVPQAPSVQLPLTDKLPKPEEVVATAYDFAQQLLASQRKFAEEILKATAPLQLGGDGTPKA